ncbi:MAG: phosphoribosylanthranilate isomerase [Campylobacterales bacterium]|nr:phosphoribosylanthranilate isomerase [Campylobacterales bacterium]
MRIKICGITNLQDAIDAIEAGASALGFVFYEKSPRYIDPFAAKNIIQQLPPFVQMVGLFVNSSQEQINEIATISKIHMAQLHFDFDESNYSDLLIPYTKVVRVKEPQDLNKYANQYRFVDAFVESYGGEGKRINLEWFDGVDCSRIILAGGLNEHNVEELKGYNFYALDLSSGVEIKKGIKDKQKMINFINKVNEIFR